MSTKPRSTRRVTRGAFVAASRSAGSRSSDSGRLRSPWLSGVRSYDDFGSRPMDWEPASPAVDRRLYIPSPPSGPSSRYVRRYVEPASRVSGRPARVVAPPPQKAAQNVEKGPSAGIVEGPSLCPARWRSGLRAAWCPS